MTAKHPARCERCGAPIPSASASRNPFPGAVARYLELHRDAMRQSDEWRRLATALEQRGYVASSAYLEIECDGLRVQIPEGDLTDVQKHYATRLAAAVDDDERRVISNARGEALARAEALHRRWRAAASEIGVELAAERAEQAWAIVDAIDLDALWATELRDLDDAVAMLALLREVGWEAAEPGDADRQQAAVSAIAASIERLK
jgi:hypothetical protein